MFKKYQTHSQKAPSSLSQKFDGMAFQYQEMRPTPYPLDLSLCLGTKMPHPLWRVFEEWSPHPLRGSTLLSGNGNLNHVKSKFQ